MQKKISFMYSSRVVIPLLQLYYSDIATGFIFTTP